VAHTSKCGWAIKKKKNNLKITYYDNTFCLYTIIPPLPLTRKQQMAATMEIDFIHPFLEHPECRKVAQRGRRDVAVGRPSPFKV
jgi:hypothetical protein